MKLGTLLVCPICGNHFAYRVNLTCSESCNFTRYKRLAAGDWSYDQDKPTLAPVPPEIQAASQVQALIQRAKSREGRGGSRLSYTPAMLKALAPVLALLDKPKKK